MAAWQDAETLPHGEHDVFETGQSSSAPWATSPAVQAPGAARRCKCRDKAARRLGGTWLAPIRFGLSAQPRTGQR